MIILDDNAMETIVGGQSLAEYALILSTNPNVAANNPVVQLGGNLNENAFHGVLTGSVVKLIKEANLLGGTLISGIVRSIHA